MTRKKGSEMPEKAKRDGILAADNNMFPPEWGYKWGLE